MPIDFRPMDSGSRDDQAVIFLSASIPDADRWAGDFDALEITDAVVSLARACLTHGYRLVTAAHPTIAPLLLYVAAEFPPDVATRILIYQSLLFDDVLPTATRRFEAEGVGSVIWTEATTGDLPEPGHWDSSLETMRTRMLEETAPVAGCFIGGMDGIPTEFAMFKSLFPGRPVYPVGAPGGEARGLVNADLREQLLLGRKLLSIQIRQSPPHRPRDWAGENCVR